MQKIIKTLMKEIKDDTDGEIYHVLGLEEYCENVIYKFNVD